MRSFWQDYTEVYHKKIHFLNYLTHLVTNVLAAIYFRIFWVIHHQTTFGEVIQSTLSRGVTRHKVLSYLLSPLLRTFYNLPTSNLIFLKKHHFAPSLNLNVMSYVDSFSPKRKITKCSHEGGEASHNVSHFPGVFIH